jgi:hypothetical protein
MLNGGERKEKAHCGVGWKLIIKDEFLIYRSFSKKKRH